MSDAPRDTEPCWRSTGPLPRCPPIDADLDVDVVVVGGGITGLTAAYLLKREGRRVALVERHRCADADTGHTTAHLTCVTDTRLADLVSTFGEDHARAVWDAGLAAVYEISEIVRLEHVDCGFTRVPGYLHAPRFASDPETGTDALQREAELAAALGFDARYVDRVPFMDRPGMEIARQARFHPRQYAAALLAALQPNQDGRPSARLTRDASCFVFEDTEVTAINADPLTVVAGGHAITCRDVIVATHTPIAGQAGFVSSTLLQTKLSLQTSYVVAGRVPKGAIPDALYWDTADPYRYLRISSGDAHDDVVFGGQDHKTGQADDTRERFDRLEAELRALVPVVDVTHRWSGQVIETADGLPLIGFTAPHQFAATGFNGNGMTFGTLAAIMARDALTDRTNPWRELFDIHRTGLRGGVWDYVKENADYPYYLIRDRLASASHSVEDVQPGTGRILTLDGRRVAAYRAPDGNLSLRSAVCTHMGCLVRWNDAERTWDCPCHGSRFSPDGDVLSGPAETPLADVASQVTPQGAPQ